MGTKSPQVTLFKLAKQLKLATSTIQEHLESLELPVPSSPMKKLTLESWEAVVEKFDPTRFREYQQELLKPDQAAETTDAADLRKQGLEELLHVDEEPRQDEKIKLPKDLYSDLKIIQQRAPVVEMDEEPEESS
ncbi:MAG: hypothetical protein ISR91_05005, partial [Candidatus Delongbacteria bacterium]|nr:hypothetical protein [Candidatus Delongbacteria bacterium]